MKKTNDVLIITGASSARTETGQLQVLDILKNYPSHISLVFAGLRPESDLYNLYSAALSGREFTASYEVTDSTLVDTLLTALKGLRKHSRVFLNDANYCSALPNFTHQKNWLGVSPVGVDQRSDYIMVGSDTEGKVLFAQKASKVENTYAWTGLAYFESVNSVINEIEHSVSKTLTGYESLAAAFTAAHTLLSVILVQDWRVYWSESQCKPSTKLGDPGDFTYEVSDTRRVFTFSCEDDASKHIDYANNFARTRCPLVRQFGRYVVQDTPSSVRALDAATTPELIEFFRLLKHTAWVETPVGPKDELEIASLPIVAAQDGVYYYRDNFDHLEVQKVNGVTVPKDFAPFFALATRRLKETSHVCKVHGSLRIDSLRYDSGKILVQDLSFKNTVNGYGNLYSEVAYLAISLGLDLEKLSHGEGTFYTERVDGVVEFAIPSHSRSPLLASVVSSLVENQVVLGLHVVLHLLALVKGQPEHVAKLLWAFALYEAAILLQRPEFMYS